MADGGISSGDLSLDWLIALRRKTAPAAGKIYPDPLFLLPSYCGLHVTTPYGLYAFSPLSCELTSSSLNRGLFSLLGLVFQHFSFSTPTLSMFYILVLCRQMTAFNLEMSNLISQTYFVNISHTALPCVPDPTEPTGQQERIRLSIFHELNLGQSSENNCRSSIRRRDTNMNSYEHSTVRRPIEDNPSPIYKLIKARQCYWIEI